MPGVIFKLWFSLVNMKLNKRQSDGGIYATRVKRKDSLWVKVSFSNESNIYGETLGLITETRRPPDPAPLLKHNQSNLHDGSIHCVDCINLNN